MLHSVTDIAVRAAHIRASQVLPTRPVISPEFLLRKAEERPLKTPLASDAQATHDSPSSHSINAFLPVNPYLSHLEEQGEKAVSEQSSIAGYAPLSTEPPPPNYPNLAVSYAPLSVEGSLSNASSPEITLDSTPSSVPIGTEGQLHEIENYVPLDSEVCI